MFKQIIFSISLLLIFTTIEAQDYVVTPQLDTIYGEIDVPLPSDYYEEVILKTSNDKTRYRAHEVRGFYENGEHYRTVKFQDKYRFMKLVKDGYLSFYQYRADGSYAFNSGFLQKKTKEGVEVPNILFKKTMTGFLSDCESVSAKIDNKELKKGDLETIIDEYNACIKQQTSMALASTPKPKVSTPTIDLLKTIAAETNNEELKILLSDIKSKLENDEKVPSYMIGALQEYVNENESVEEDLKILIDQLKSS